MSRNIAEQYRRRVEAVHRKLAEEMATAARQLGEKLREETVERTPGDNGDLRDKWAQMPPEKKGDRWIIKITNPAEYAAYVEFGYMQRPGMILKMHEERGKLRFQRFLGYASKYGLGAPTGRVPPDEDGNVVIVTRKYFIEGKFMAREGLKVTQETHWPRLRAYLLRRMRETWERV